MTEKHYQLIVSGPADGADVDTVSRKVAEILRLSEAKAAKLFEGPPKVLKRNADRASCEKLQAVLERAGAVSRIEEQSNGSASRPSNPAKERFSVDQFVQTTRQRDRGHGLFELETDRFLEVNLKDELWIKTGAMVAYHGDIRFTREGVFEHGLKKLLKRSFTGEGTQLTRASGQGAMYLADSGKKITIIKLESDAIYVNGNDLLAFEPTIEWDVQMMRKATAMLAGGLFNVRLSGHGMIAITTHFDPITLKVTPDKPIMTDPNATVAWSGSLQPDLKTDISFKTFLGRGSGESIQMLFKGNGFVVVQPYEETPFQTGQATR